MSLGNYFPDSFKRESAIRNVAPGMVIKLRVLMDDGVEHEKRFLILHVDENTTTCVINSEINPFILNNDHLLKCQVKLDIENHSFMNWDSHIDCTKVKNYSTQMVVDTLINKPEWVLGQITSSLRDEVISALKHSRQIAPIDSAIYCASLSSAQLDKTE